MARRRHSNRRRRGGFGFLYKLLSTLVICVVIVVALTLFFRVDAIEITGVERYTETQVSAASGVEIGDNLILMDKYGVAARIREALPYIEHIHPYRRLPDTLVIEVRECGEPLALVQDDTAWLVSPGGRIVEAADLSAAQDRPVIDGCTLLEPAVGKAVSLTTAYAAQQQSLLDLLTALEDTETLDRVDAIHLDDIAMLVMDYDARFRVELPYGADYPAKLRFLRWAVEESDSIQSNQTGTIQLTRDDGKVLFIEDR